LGGVPTTLPTISGHRTALTIAQTAIDTCKRNGYAVSVTVVGRNGEFLVQVRGGCD
jgi:uncharacterized protein GlcG (DUF336 family)